jgi:hypothetical protein
MLKLSPIPIVSIMFILVLGTIFAPDAHAYIDPASGSALLQLILGGLAGIGVVAKLYWGRVKETCRSLLGRADRNE